MAIAIKSVPVLTGETAERFIRMAEKNEASRDRTIIPVKLKDSIRRMMERSASVIINAPK